jgi:hypothetical protein
MTVETEWIRHNDDFIHHTHVPERYRVTMARPIDAHIGMHKHRVHHMVAEQCTEIKLTKLMRHDKRLIFHGYPTLREGANLLYENGFAHVHLIGSRELEIALMREHHTMLIDDIWRDETIFAPYADALEVINRTPNTPKWGTEVIGAMIGENAIKESNERISESYSGEFYNYEWYYGYDIVLPEGIVLLTNETRQRIGKI